MVIHEFTLRYCGLALLVASVVVGLTARRRSAEFRPEPLLRVVGQAYQQVQLAQQQGSKQAPPQTITPEPAPQIPEEIKRLHFLEGTWRGEASLEVEGQTRRLNLSQIHRLVADGFGIQTQEAADFPEGRLYEAVNLFGFESGRKIMHLYTINSRGDVRDRTGRWTSPNTLELQYEGVQSGQPLVEKRVLTIKSPQEYHFTSRTTLGGKAYSAFSATMHKVK